MQTAWGLTVTILSLACWGGQMVAWFAPETAIRLGLVENPSEVEPPFQIDARGEALWDLLTLWTMAVAGVLLVIDHAWWPYFGLVGGGAYLYFAGRGITVRVLLRRHGVRIGTRSNVNSALTALTVWGLTAAITIFAAVNRLQ
jgi:hypothetical protein